MKQFDKVTNLKLRLGYGRTGSSAIDPYMTQNLLNTGKTATGSDNVPYYAPSSTFPEDLKWETTSQWDIGADLGLFNQRLRFTADYYYKKTTDLLNTVPCRLRPDIHRQSGISAV